MGFNAAITGWLEPLLNNLGITGTYAEAAGLFFIFIAIMFIAYFLLTRYVKMLTRKTATHIDDVILEKTTTPISAGIALYGLKLALDHLNLKDESLILRAFDSAVIFVIFLVVKIILDVFIDFFVKPSVAKTKSSFDDAILPLLHKTIMVFVYGLAFVFILKSWSVDVTPLLASLGIAGIAIAFALQSTLGNVLSGVSLVLDRNIKPGDAIETSGVAGAVASGTVVDITFRSTKIQTPNNEIVIIPNSQLANSAFKNLAEPDPTLRVEIDVSAAYGSDVEHVKRVLLEQVKKIKSVHVIDTPAPSVLFLEMGDFALKFKLFFWIARGELAARAAAKDEANTLVYAALQKEKIQIPFPTRTIYMKQK